MELGGVGRADPEVMFVAFSVRTGRMYAIYTRWVKP